ncbi:MAG TPA: hypothetical protein VJ385_10940 [Fibrobacteria bacterium]|nr:hypothetical protein [Fibrobacteria bacterium]
MATIQSGKVLAAVNDHQVTGSPGQYFGTNIGNHSGHYQPSEESTQVGRDAFGEHGITFPE